MVLMKIYGVSLELSVLCRSITPFYCYLLDTSNAIYLSAVYADKKIRNNIHDWTRSTKRL